MTNLVLPPQFDTSLLHNIWKYDMVNISGNHITLSNITVAILVLFIGLRYSKKITHILLKIISPKLNLDQHEAYTIEKLISFTFSAVTILLSMQIANIPLSIFAFIGGAFAIGLGLGAQGLVSNFINTLIIMIEKPLKIGDIVETQGMIGKVKAIGTRCTTIDSFTSGEVLIPHVNLMQNALSKWACSDNKISCHVYINVLKDEKHKINHVLIMKKIGLAAETLDFISLPKETEIYLTKIAKKKDQFCLNFKSNIDLLKQANSIKNGINLALLTHLKENFTVEYSKNLGEPTLDSAKLQSSHGK